MLRVEINNTKPGMTLAMRVEHPTQRGHTLLRIGYELDTESIRRLRGLGTRHVWVHYPAFDYLRDFVDEKILARNQEVIDHISATFKTVEQGAAAKLPYKAYTQSIGELVVALIKNPKAALYLEGLVQRGDDDLMRHSSAVTYISLLMGLKLEGYLVKQRKRVIPARAKKVTNIGIGAMLHDIGVTGLDIEVRRHHMTTGDESDPQWQEHPSLGYEMVRGKVDPSASTIVLNHHQRCDGSGFAGADRPVLDGQRIHVFARIVAVADTFDRLLHPITGEDRPTVAALANLLDESCLNQFDPQVIKALLAVVPPYAPGSIVQLNDGRWAVVTNHNVNLPCRPEVQIIPDPDNLSPKELPPGESIDLGQEPDRDMFITLSDEHDVAQSNFKMPNLRREGFLEVPLV